MDNDDKQVGRVLTRREALVLLGASGVSLLGGCVTSNTRTDSASSAAGGSATMSAGKASSADMCVVRPEQPRDRTSSTRC